MSLIEFYRNMLYVLLLRIDDNYPKYVLSMDTVFGNDVKGIQRINLVDFLLGHDRVDSL